MASLNFADGANIMHSSFDLSEQLSSCSSKGAPSLQEIETAEMKGQGRAQWLEKFWIPLQQRKNPGLTFSLVGGYKLCIQHERTSETSSSSSEPHDQNSEEALLTATTTTTTTCWAKNIANALKKIEVEDLGDMDAMELKQSIPEQDANGRGMRDLETLEKQLSIKVVFLSNNKHVLLVGNKTKLEKKAFVVRNMLAHYHWRLSGKDVSCRVGGG